MHFMTIFFSVPAVCVHLGSFSALVAIASLLTKCVMDTGTAFLAQMKLSVQIKVQN